jgi:hypothetical protein
MVKFKDTTQVETSSDDEERPEWETMMDQLITEKTGLEMNVSNCNHSTKQFHYFIRRKEDSYTNTVF